METFWWSLIAFIFSVILLLRIVRDAVVHSLPIPSLLLVRDDEPQRRFRGPPPWWLWLFLAGLTFVAIGATMPFDTPDPEAPVRIVALVETGLPAMAREGRTTRLDLARRAIRDHLNRLEEERYLFTLVAANAFPAMVGEWTPRRGTLEHRLDELVPTAAPTDWTAALDLVRTLVGLTDAKVLVAGSRIGEPLRAWHEANNDFPADLVPLPVGTSQRNRGFDSLTASIRQDPETGEERTLLEVAVRGAGPGVSEEWMRQRFGLVVRSPEGVLRPRIAGPTYAVADDGSAGVLERYSLALPGRFDELSIALVDPQDALEVDDQAIVTFRPPPDILVADPRTDRRPTVIERLKAATPIGSLEVVAELTEGIDLAAYDLLIVNDRVAPDEIPPDSLWPPLHSLVYADDRDTRPVRFADDVPCRLTRYVNVVSPFNLRAKTVDMDESLQAVLYHKPLRPLPGKAEPLAAWGEREGRRKVAIGWDWVTDAAEAHLTLSIVWLHALDWLGPNESRPGALWAGEHFPAPPGETVFRLVPPGGVEREIQPIRGRIEAEALLEVGRYRLLDSEGQDLPFAVNARWADLRVDEGSLKTIAGRACAPSAMARGKRKDYKGLGWWRLAAVILSVELGWYLFTRRRPLRTLREA